MSDPLGDMKANTGAPLALLEAARRWAPHAHVIFASTRQVYGKAGELPVNESRAVSPVDVNGVHKFAAETHHKLYWEHHGVRTNVLRLTNTYGPGMRLRGEGRMFLGEWFRRLLRAEPIALYGCGTQLRDLNHVDDVVAAFLLAAMQGASFPGEVFNLGAPEALSLKHLADLLARVAGTDLPARHQPFPDDLAKIEIGSYRGDFTKIKTAFGWEPRIELEDGLRQTFEELRENGDTSAGGLRQ
jgi:nucleoside-diphosphate-sugar epimerase